MEVIAVKITANNNNMVEEIIGDAVLKRALEAGIISIPTITTEENMEMEDWEADVKHKNLLMRSLNFTNLN